MMMAIMIIAAFISGKCYNIATKLKIKKRIADILIDELKNNIGSDSNLDFLFKKISNNIDSIADAVYSKSKISSVMEYSRSLMLKWTS